MRKLIFEKEAPWVPGNGSVGIVTVTRVIQKAYLTLEQARRRGMGAGGRLGESAEVPGGHDCHRRA